MRKEYSKDIFELYLKNLHVEIEKDQSILTDWEEDEEKETTTQ